VEFHGDLLVALVGCIGGEGERAVMGLRGGWVMRGVWGGHMGVAVC
jgi:hypothetical protein